jgi:hypothetical protein
MSDDNWHVILVPKEGHIICSCAGVNWCSHIDATLVAGERAMVPQEEHGEANRAQIAAKNRIHIPTDWQANWRKNRKWRGLPSLRKNIVEISRQNGRPVLSIEGRGKERKNIEKLSIDSGWVVLSVPVKGCLFHIVPNDTHESNRIEKANQAQIPVATYKQWEMLASELGSILSKEILRTSEKDLQDEQNGD